MKKKLPIGGQAVIEGVLMRSPEYVATSVRVPSGKIITRCEHWPSYTKKYKVLGLPFIRGVTQLVEMMVMGYKALGLSAQLSAGEDEEPISTFALVVTLVLALGFGLLLFLVLPYALTSLLGIVEESKPIIFNIVDGLIKIAIFVLYVYLISFMKDIKRTFQYHGAEHMAVHCYEHDKKLTKKNVWNYPTFHPRCGTTFIMLVLIVGILIFSLTPVLAELLIPGFFELGFWTQKGILLGMRLLFVLPVAAVSYEVLKLAGKHYEEGPLYRMMIWPGKLIQGITTQKPDDSQIDVAIASLKKVLSEEEKQTIKKES